MGCVPVSLNGAWTGSNGKIQCTVPLRLWFEGCFQLDLAKIGNHASLIARVLSPLLRLASLLAREMSPFARIQYEGHAPKMAQIPKFDLWHQPAQIHRMQ